MLYKGSFIHSSQNIRIENNILYADLRKIDGSYNSTSIEFNPNIEYDNIDGNFNISHNNIKMLNITMNLSEQSVDKEIFSGVITKENTQNILNNNIIIITTTLPNNEISEKRRNNIVNNFHNYNIPILFSHGIVNNNNISNNNIMFEIIKNALNIYKTTKYKYAIICDDDFNPIDNFLEELNKTIYILPNNWRSLHLCPGYLWGRKYRDNNKIGILNPEYNMDGIEFHESGRFYINCNSETYFDKKFWLGGPISFLINQNNIDSFLNDFVSNYNINNNPNDVILTKILNENDYICREPILGFENEQGGSTFNDLITKNNI